LQQVLQCVHSVLQPLALLLLRPQCGSMHKQLVARPLSSRTALLQWRMQG
jgi:hypothetical protein